MQTHLCEFCLRSGMLCSKCREKIRSGAITDLYVKVAQAIQGIEGEFPLLQKAKLEDAIEAGGILLLVVGRGDQAKLAGYGGKMARAFHEALNRRVMVMEEGLKDRRFLEDLFAGQEIITINIIWLPDGSTETRVVLGGRRQNRLSDKRIGALRELAKKVRNMDIRVEYAR